MIYMMKKMIVAGMLSSLLLTACSQNAPPDNLRLTQLPASQLRAMQSRQFDQPDPMVGLRSAIKALSGLDFQIVRVDDQVGLIEAIRLENGGIMQANVSVNKMAGHGCLVRIVLRYNQQIVTAEAVYQVFFDTLSRDLS